VDAWGQHQGWLEILAHAAGADPELAPEISLRRSTRAADALLREEIDLAFGLPTALDKDAIGSGLRTLDLRLDACGLLVSGLHRLAGRDVLPCEELAGIRIWMAPSTPPEVDRCIGDLVMRFGGTAVTTGVNLGLQHAGDAAAGPGAYRGTPGGICAASRRRRPDYPR
jgi:DNA-binding transcriptional LysR family regulator